MLKQVKFKNFKSFTKETVISLEATKSAILKYTNTYNNILKGVCFYGPNSSGKSNALEAISILPRLLFETDGITIAKLFSVYNEEGTMYFEYVFKIDSSDIVYYFEMNRLGQFVNEKLKLNGKKILTRTINNAESCLSVSDTVDENNLYTTVVDSFTKGTSNTVCVDKRFLKPGDKCLIVDDFLAEGNASIGLIDLCKQAGAEVVGVAIVIEKGFQNGRKRLEKLGVHVESAAIVDHFENGKVILK